MSFQTRIDTGLDYRPGKPVRVRVIHREHRTSVTDDGGAVELAGTTRDLGRATQRVLAEFDVNVNRLGVIELPVVPIGPSEQAVVCRIAEASLALYQELLESSR
jgi:hypothetical protein